MCILLVCLVYIYHDALFRECNSEIFTVLLYKENISKTCLRLLINALCFSFTKQDVLLPTLQETWLKTSF